MLGRNKISQALIDLNGTCHIGAQLIPGANLAVRQLLENDVKAKFERKFLIFFLIFEVFENLNLDENKVETPLQECKILRKLSK